MIFDGGRFSHEVTKVERGSRISLIFQHTVWRPRPILDLDDPAVLETLAKAKP
jgi:hypothetical protein